MLQKSCPFYHLKVKLLISLSFVDTSQQTMIKESGGLQKLLNDLKSSDEDAVENAAGTIWNMCSTNGINNNNIYVILQKKIGIWFVNMRADWML